MKIEPSRYTITTDNFIYHAIYIEQTQKWIIHRRPNNDKECCEVFCLTSSGWETIISPIIKKKVITLRFFNKLEDIVAYINSERYRNRLCIS